MGGVLNSDASSTSRSTDPATGAAAGRRAGTGPYLDEVTGVGGAHTPVWFMRQAGRSLPEYKKVRAGSTMLEACFDPAMTCEITLQPVRRHGVDAAIFFSDIVIPLAAAGVDIDIVPGTGPVVAEPIRDEAGVAALPELTPDRLEKIEEAVRLVVAELDPQVALIGFAGAPFTLASYLIEGGPSRNHEHTKSLMYSRPDVWNALMAKLADLTTVFLRAQIAAGVDAVQLFDSWAGALSLRDYRSLVLPHSTRIFADEIITTVPRTHFGVGTGELLGAMGEAGPEVVGVDWRIPLDDAAGRAPGKVLQGNLDPAMLFADRSALDGEVRRILDEGQRARDLGARGHVFNLGHGVLPTTDPGAVTHVVELIHELTGK
ncbi:uroporphyrinogen decarboxylase [Dietzia maris]|jgi:uroporphyrinogen decarboxylase|uniref:uroporphyrinogen decarboxylase n=1 Tax=Dietzia TaxID=37914 RepID=UPI0036F3B49C